MRRFLTATGALTRSVHGEVGLQLKAGVTRALMSSCALAGVISALWPSLVEGKSATAGAFAAVSGAIFASWVCCVGAPMLVFTSLGRQFDSGTRSAALLTGVPPVRSVAATLGSCLLVVWLGVLAGATTGLIVGVSDQLRRALAGPSATFEPVSVQTLILTIVAVLAAFVLASLLVLILRSGRGAAALLTALLVTGVLALYLVPVGPVRTGLVAHPLGWIWVLAYRGPSLTVQIDAPAMLAGIVGLVWTTVAGVALWWLRPWTPRH